MTIETWAEINARHKRDKIAAIEGLALTMTQSDVARALGVTRSFVNQFATKHGIRFYICQRGRRSKFTDNDLRDAAKSCTTTQEIADKLGCGVQAIYSRARQARIVLPTRRSVVYNLLKEMTEIQGADFRTFIANEFTIKEALVKIGRDDLIRDEME